MRLPLPVFVGLLTILALFSGTTFVVKENGQEVGRYQAADGREEVRVIENVVPRPSIAPGQATEPERPAVEDWIPAREKMSAYIFWKWYLGIIAVAGVTAFLAWKQKRTME